MGTSRGRTYIGVIKKKSCKESRLIHRMRKNSNERKIREHLLKTLEHVEEKRIRNKKAGKVAAHKGQCREGKECRS